MRSVSIVKYYFNLFLAYSTYYLHYAIDMFADYPPEVQVAVCVAVLCVFLMIMMALALIYLSRKTKRLNKLKLRLEDRFGKGMDYMLSADAKDRMSKREIAAVFGIDKEIIGKEILKNRREKEVFVQMFYLRFITERSDYANRDNITALLYLFVIPEFVEKEVSLRNI